AADFCGSGTVNPRCSRPDVLSGNCEPWAASATGAAAIIARTSRRVRDIDTPDLLRQDSSAPPIHPTGSSEGVAESETEEPHGSRSRGRRDHLAEVGIRRISDGGAVAGVVEQVLNVEPC